PPPAPPPPPPGPRSREQTLVMIADDSKVVRVKTSRLLAKMGYRVVLAEDGQDALNQFGAELPHLLITDVEMPGMDGFALTRHVRGDARTATLPIIMITSADDRLREAAAEAGVTVLMGKPYADDDLLAQIERHAGVSPA
ncbi:MAG: response regulator, partial [Rubrivivax sp.]